ncbi:uncharacterized protein BJ171DRAFT_418261 [Polychytrium aggregatum]|uniref:uncharacterized protein n=1 Tax=Polychytrium aggregatum TaxID=110093 RepID=UPI0022FE8BDC|nr:uncharacterized protein BJ171DRAFT_418261 [Polychytrium aggregatum]KAI9209919.1 hypothetical protein BJ171DRAFT_418261 [Polychytrium aggregatum]
MPYQDGDSILLVGEGNLSFARALVEIVPRSLLTATVFDSEKIVMEKYPDAARNIKAVADSGGAVLFGIDATKLEGYRKLRNKRFDKIVFNFPHAGAGIKDQDRNIQINQELLSSFFLSALPFLKSRTTYQDPVDGEIHVTLKEGEPYESWRIKKLAQMTGLLKCATSFEFVPQIYPGYAHRRTIGFQEGISKDHNEELQLKRCRTFVFVRVDAKDDTGTYRPGWNSRHRSRRRRAQDSDRSDSDDAQDGDGDGLGDEDGSNEAE